MQHATFEEALTSGTDVLTLMAIGMHLAVTLGPTDWAQESESPGS